MSTHCQLVLVLRYINANNNIQEHFFEFITIQNATADAIATVLLERLSTILCHSEGEKGQNSCTNKITHTRMHNTDLTTCFFVYSNSNLYVCYLLYMCCGIFA